MQKQYLQPLIVGMLAGVSVGGYIFYRSADPMRSLTIGGFAFLILFWVVLRGNKLIERKQADVERTTSETTDAS